MCLNVAKISAAESDLPPEKAFVREQDAFLPDWSCLIGLAPF
jgi:hypothetical protein